MKLTGSKALEYYCDKVYNGSDYDIIASESELNQIGLSFCGEDFLHIANGKVEFLNADALNNNQLMPKSSNYNFVIDINGHMITCDVASLSELYIQKRSHMHRPHKFCRNIFMLQDIKNLNGHQLDARENEILKARIKLTKDKYGDKHPSLNKTNEKFFDDYVEKFYVHDDIHCVVAYYDEPIYERLKIDDSLAKCEKSLWDNLSHDDKIKCVREEGYVIALERFIIPKLIKNEFHITPKNAFGKALEKICTTLTSGWFRDFAIDNFFTILEYDVDFLGKFKNSNLRRIK